MKKLIPIVSALALMASGVAAPSALALTKASAEGLSLEKAQNKWGATATLKECVNSGKNEEGVAQWFCNGHLNFGAEVWKINLGPFGGITFEQK